MLWLFFSFALVALTVDQAYDVCCDAAENCKAYPYMYIHFNGHLLVFFTVSSRMFNATIQNTVPIVNTFIPRSASSPQLYQFDLKTACICTRKNVGVDAPPLPMTTDNKAVKTARLLYHRQRGEGHFEADAIVSFAAYCRINAVDVVRLLHSWKLAAVELYAFVVIRTSEPCQSTSE